jgi:pimeloyl-ACP methyl ester carboxylesterase
MGFSIFTRIRRAAPFALLGSLVVSSGCRAEDSASAGTSEAEATADVVIRSIVPCGVSGIRDVEVPVSLDANARRLQLHYRVFPGRQPGAPTVVVLPGGPGDPIMQKSPSDVFALGAVPDDYTVIYVDPRGVGCNTFPPLEQPDETVFTTENLARDAVAIIEKEGLDDFFLYGASYGSAHATVTAAFLAAGGLPRPRRIVLEGALGRAAPSFDAYFAAYQAEWKRVLPLLDPWWRDGFKYEPWSPLLHWSRDQWGMFVSAQLILGDFPGHGPILDYWLDGLSRNDPAAQSYVGGFMAGVGQGEASPLFRTIACRELFGGWRSGREIRNGELHAVGDDICAGTSFRAAHPYDSKAWSVGAPVTYFHGPFDPTTTTAHAEYHRDGHEDVHRQFVTVPDASHAPLTLGLAARGCAANVWRALESDDAALKSALATCTRGDEAPVKVEVREPGQ